MNQKTRQQAIEILASGDPVVYAGLIEKFVWANTAQPKYKVGDAVQFSDRLVTIHRYRRLPNGQREEQKQRVLFAIGKVTEVRMDLGARAFMYAIEYETDLEGWEVNGQGVTNHRAFRMEVEISPADAYRTTMWSELGGK